MVAKAPQHCRVSRGALRPRPASTQAVWMDNTRLDEPGAPGGPQGRSAAAISMPLVMRGMSVSIWRSTLPGRRSPGRRSLAKQALASLRPEQGPRQSGGAGPVSRPTGRPIDATPPPEVRTMGRLRFAHPRLSSCGAAAPGGQRAAELGSGDSTGQVRTPRMPGLPRLFR
jgi:hypothetical protein